MQVRATGSLSTEQTGHDPVAIENTKKIINNHRNLEFISEWETTLSSIDAIVVATKWTEYKKLSS